MQPSDFQLILASSSTYRKELLSRLQLPFICIAPQVDESPLRNEKPYETALRLAQLKAQAVAQRQPDSIIIGSDQVATLDDIQIGKPGTHGNALKQLQHMRGREVIFHTALCVIDTRPCRSETKPTTQTDNIITKVRFKHLPDAVLEQYLHIEQPYDCAGSAKNEGLGICLLSSIESQDPTALTGLPLIRLCSMLETLNIAIIAT